MFLGPLIGTGSQAAQGNVDPVSVWVAAVVANGGTVSAGRQTLIRALVASFMTTGLWGAAYDIAILAAENAPSALTTLKRRTLMTAVGTIPFVVDRGFTSDGSTGYINTNSIPPQIAPVRLSIYERTSLAFTTSTYAMAAADGTVTGGTWAIRPLTAALSAGVNAMSGGSTIATTATSNGYTVVSKDLANLATLIKNGAVTGSATGATNAAQSITIPIYIGARNQSGVANGFRAAQEAYADWGDIIPLANEAAAYAALQAYMTAIGANV